ncbi:MAG: hypothetical protein ABI977_35870 [Acidobacteriota bacterium]
MSLKNSFRGFEGISLMEERRQVNPIYESSGNFHCATDADTALHLFKVPANQ